jgi:hypothetical protein
MTAERGMARTIASQNVHRFERTEAVSDGLRTGALSVQWTPLAEFCVDTRTWRDLFGRALEPNVFLEPAFAAAANRLERGGVGIVSVQRDAQLIALLPGRVEGWAAARPVPTFIAWTHPFAPLSTPLVDRDAAAEAVAAIFDFLPHMPGTPKLALFPLMNTEGPVAALIHKELASRGKDLRAFGAHPRAALIPGDAGPIGSSGRRKELRRQRRRLSESGALMSETVSSSEGVRSAVADYLAVEASGWKGRAGDAAQSNPATEHFLGDAVADLAAEGKARVDLLKLDGRAIAAAIVLRSGDRAWFWKIAYDETFARFSPGVQLALDLTESLKADRSLSIIDSCAVADHPMIDQLWSGRIAMGDWLIQLDGHASFEAGVTAEYARRGAISSLKVLRNRLR